MNEHLTGTPEVPQNLTDRVQARVDIARLIVDRRLNATHSKSEQNDRPVPPVPIR